MRKVYADHPETFYCGCKINWSGHSSAKPNLESCGYQVRKNNSRANTIEWEHVVPAHSFGQQRPCWRNGGRKNCIENDPVFRKMEADMFNLVPAIGEVNGDRANYRFGVLPATPPQHGLCPVKIDFQQRVVEPRELVRGEIARINFYMYDRYNLRMSNQQQQLFIAWNKLYPPSEWERKRHDRVAKVTEQINPFVTGEKIWTLGYKPSGAVVASKNKTLEASPASSNNAIRGNKNSRVYHLPTGCPGYKAMKASNIVQFQNEEYAKKAGYRKAGNCR